MKKILLFFAVLIFTAGATFAEGTDNSDIYVKSVPISKIYNLKPGFRIVYMKSDSQMQVFYIPYTWFETAAVTGSAPKAEILYGQDSAYPYFSIFWVNGKFNHIRLYVKSDLNDPSWGENNPNWGNIDDKFKVDTLKLEF